MSASIARFVGSLFGLPLTQSLPRKNPVLLSPMSGHPQDWAGRELGVGESHLPLPPPVSPELDLGLVLVGGEGMVFLAVGAGGRGSVALTAVELEMTGLL